MNVGDRVKWLPTGQEGRIFEVRDGGIVAVRGEDWAVYDYADRFELVNEPVSGRDGPDMAERTHAVIDAAIQWWLARRPVGWSEAQHLERPAINTTTPREAQLASAVAEFVRHNEDMPR